MLSYRCSRRNVKSCSVGWQLSRATSTTASPCPVAFRTAFANCVKCGVFLIRRPGPNTPKCTSDMTAGPGWGQPSGSSSVYSGPNVVSIASFGKMFRLEVRFLQVATCPLPTGPYVLARQVAHRLVHELQADRANFHTLLLLVYNLACYLGVRLPVRALQPLDAPRLDNPCRSWFFSRAGGLSSGAPLFADQAPHHRTG